MSAAIEKLDAVESKQMTGKVEDDVRVGKVSLTSREKATSTLLELEALVVISTDTEEPPSVINATGAANTKATEIIKVKMSFII